MMLGFANYYYGIITQNHLLNRWIYILYYSCLKTLATKFRISTRQLTERYSYRDITPTHRKHKVKPDGEPHHTDLRIVIPFQKIDKNGVSQTRYTVLLNYKEVISRCAVIRYNQRFTKGVTNLDTDFLTNHKRYWRTSFKLSQCCCICGDTSKIEMHHIRKLEGLRAKGFSKILVQLGRKQIPVCPTCHRNIHKGIYDGLSLRELYDTKVATAEGLIRYTDPDVAGQLRWDDPSKKLSIRNKTISFPGASAYEFNHDHRKLTSNYILSTYKGLDNLKQPSQTGEK